MDLRNAILTEHSKANTLLITNWIGNNQDRFNQLMELFFNEEYRIVQRAAWVMNHSASAHPHLIQPHLERLLIAMESPKHDAVVRNGMKILAETKFHPDFMGRAASLAFDLLAHPKSPVAIKVHSMQLLANICRDEPDLAGELRILIEDQWEESTAGFKSRGKKILKQLDKIQSP
ncbi:MAG: hypothetical protein KTR30_34950 [Saprospiraceae bacterium]|nr:hypothetical protein [Saprospiraceae bacterium]